MNNNYYFNDLLKNKGLKVTKHRISILEILYKNEEPISAEEIYDKLKTSNISISLSSIYKILDTFTTNKLINKCIIKNDSKTYFEINNSTHKHHLICKKCNKVLPIENCPLCKFEKELHDDMDFDITEHRLEFYGYCKTCKNKFDVSDN